MSGKGYPRQPSYPVQQTASYPVQQVSGQTAYVQTTAPPAYSAVAGSQPQEPPPPYSYAPPQQVYTGMGQYQMMQQPMMQQGYPVMMQQQAPSSGQQVHCYATFDSGARFDGIAQPRIPPPPPGCPPNQAQMASMQGHTVIASRQKSDWFSGGNGGGVNFGI